MNINVKGEWILMHIMSCPNFVSLSSYYSITSSNYGTSHVLVLANFTPSTRTTELEKLFENFKDRGFVIRWVNDTVALAVFRTPPVGKYKVT
ncbi:hypothetical protein JHK87_055189 [Glycine soja]|nr:hypothetical protein JHK87_055189 [Glycine soja]